MAFYDPMILEVHVLLVDPNTDILLKTAILLQSNSYKVTAIQEASVASSMLYEGNIKFDVVIVDVSSYDLQSFKLVHDAVSKGISVILMSDKANATLVKCAIEDGAFLFMEKPIVVDELKYLWQHVLREKARRNQEMRFGEGSSDHNHNENYYQFGRQNMEDENTNDDMGMNRNSSKNKLTYQKGRVERIDFGSSDNNVLNQYVKPKTCTEWTPELHEKFIAAVTKLGDGKCFPKDILELMNVPGLTRMQVASHLQKCRHGWQPSRDRRPRPKKGSDSANSHPHRSKTKMYGSFPHLIQGSKATIGNMEYSTHSPGTNNMGQQQQQQGTSDNNVSNYSITNEIISSGTVHGSMVVASDQGLQTDDSFDFVSSVDALLSTDFDLQEFDNDHVVVSNQVNLTTAVNPTTCDAINEEHDFWSSWIAEVSRDC